MPFAGDLLLGSFRRGRGSAIIVWLTPMRPLRCDPLMQDIWIMKPLGRSRLAAAFVFTRDRERRDTEGGMHTWTRS
jgi:hypothetical protein